MKDQLLSLYKDHLASFKNVVQSFPHDDLAGPFMMSPDADIYKSQPNPLLVVGQETSGWSYFVNEPEKQMGTYESFAVGRGQGGNAFWSSVRKIEQALGNEPHSCAWTNISRFDFYGSRPHGKYEKAIAKLDGLVKEEIGILAPAVCLFFTGPYFDNRLKKAFPGLELEPVAGWDAKALCRMQHPDLPAFSFRSYHPRFLKLKCLERSFIDFVSGLAVYHTPSNILQA